MQMSAYLRQQMWLSAIDMNDLYVVGNDVIEPLGDNFVTQLRNRLKDIDINLTFSDSGMKLIISCGFDPHYVASPMKRQIQREIETAVAKVILENPDISGKTIHVDANDEQYIVTVK